MNLENELAVLKSERDKKQEPQGLIVGTCTEFCPTYERLDRMIKKDINKFELIIIKKYRRSAAGKTKSFSEDIRPIKTLLNVVDYLISLLNSSKAVQIFQQTDYSQIFESIYSKTNQSSLHDLYKFIEDRFRAVRLDITVQSLSCNLTIQTMERICRFYIVFSHLLYDYDAFELHLNVDQLKKILVDLMELYSKRGEYNEEFCIYAVLVNVADTEKSFKLKPMIRNNIGNIITAYAQRSLYMFDKITKTLDYLQVCSLLPTIQTFLQNVLCNMKIAIVGTFPISKIKKHCILNTKEIKTILEKEGIKMHEENALFNQNNYDPIEMYVKRYKNEYLNNMSVIAIELLIKWGNINHIIYKAIINEYIKVKINETIDKHKYKNDLNGNNINYTMNNFSNDNKETILNINNMQNINYNQNDLHYRDECNNNKLINQNENNNRNNKTNKASDNTSQEITIRNDILTNNLKNNTDKNINISENNQHSKNLDVINHKNLTANSNFMYLFNIIKNSILKEYLKQRIYDFHQQYILQSYAKETLKNWHRTIKGKKSILFVFENTDILEKLPGFLHADFTSTVLCQIEEQDLSDYNFIFFIVRDQTLKSVIDKKYWMYNIFVDFYENVLQKLLSEEFIENLVDMKKVVTSMLLDEISEKPRSEQFDFLWMLAQNKRNTSMIERNISFLHNFRKLVNCRIYYEIK